MADPKMVCPECHDRCQRVLQLWLGKKQKSRGASAARREGRDPGYYDGLVDGVEEAFGHLGRAEGGFDWGQLQVEVDQGCWGPVRDESLRLEDVHYPSKEELAEVAAYNSRVAMKVRKHGPCGYCNKDVIHHCPAPTDFGPSSRPLHDQCYPAFFSQKEGEE